MDKSLIQKPLDNISGIAKNIGTEDADDLAVMQYLAQVASTAQLVKLRKLEESKVPTGIKPIKMTIPDTVTKVQLYIPWISFSLINDGAGALTVWVNDESDPLQEGMIASGENYDCNFDYPVIKKLYLKAANGTTAAIRIYGKEGRIR